MNLANILTMTRIFLVPIYLFVFYSSFENRLLYSGIVLIFSGITDMLDGYVARKYNMVTKLGTILDPIADKLTTFSILISFTSQKLIPLWLLILLSLKELSLLIGGGILYYSGNKKVIPADRFGKNAAFSFYVAIISIIFKLPEVFVTVLLYLTVILHLIAFFNYFLIFNSIMKDKEI